MADPRLAGPLAAPPARRSAAAHRPGRDRAGDCLSGGRRTAARGARLRVRAPRRARACDRCAAQPRGLDRARSSSSTAEPISCSEATDGLRRDFGSALPADVAGVVDAARVAYDTEPWQLVIEGQPPNPVRRTLVLHAGAGVTDHLQLVDGRLPGAGSFDPPPPIQDPEHPIGGTVHLELAMSRDTATAMGIQLGDHLDMTERSRAGFFGGGPTPEPTVIGEVVGLYAVPEPDDPFWAGDHRLVAPNVGDVAVDGSGVISAEGLTTLFGSWPRLLTLTYTYPISADRVAAASPSRLVTALNGLRQAFSAFQSDLFIPVEARTGLATLLNAYLAGQRQAFLLLALVGIGVAGIAAAAILLLAVMLAERRRAALVIQRERGAGALQLILPALAEALLITSPGARRLAARDPPLPAAAAGDLPLRMALAVAGLASVACVAMVAPLAARDLRGLLRTRLAPAHPTARRLVIDGLVVALAVIGVLFVRSRGVTGSAPGSAPAAASGELNLYLAAVPLLAGLAAGLVVLRVYPYPVRGVARLAGRLRGLVAPLALRRAGRAPGAVHVPLVALLVAAALGAFGATVAASIAQGQSLAAWRRDRCRLPRHRA